MADGSITIEIKSDSGDLEKDLRNIKQEAKEVERALSMDGGGLDKASRAADELDDALDDAAQAADRLGDEVEGSSGGVSKLSGGFSVLKGAAAGVVAELAGRAIDAFVDLGSEAINAADSLTKFESTMSFAGFSTAEIDAARDAVQNYASQTVYDLGEVANTTAQLAANGVQDYQKLTEAAGNLNAVAGGSADTFGSVAMVLTQTAGAGKLTTENWNQLADAIPGASGVIQNELKAMGAYTGEFRDAMAKGEISAEEFNQAIMNLGFSEAAVEASSSVSTIEGAVGNLRATIVDGFVAVLTDGGLMEGITGFINGIATILTNAGQYIGPAIQSIKDSITGIGDAFRNAFGEERSAAILNFLSQLASAMIAVPFQVVAAAVEVVATAFELLIGVVGGVVDFFTGSLPNAFNAISTAIGAITPSLGDFGNYFRREFESMNTNASKSFENLKNNASKSWENLKSKVTESAENLNTNASKSFEQLRSAVSEKTESAKQKATEAFERLKSDVTSKVDQAKQAVTTAFQNIVSAISSALNNALSQAKSILSNILSALTSWGSNMLSSAKSAMSNVVNGIASTLRTAISQVASIGSQIIAGLANAIASGASRVVSSIVNVVRNAIAAAKSALGIASPSKVFKSIGAFTMQGFAVGIDKAGDSAIKATDKVNDALISRQQSAAERLSGLVNSNMSDKMTIAVEGEVSRISAMLGERAGGDGSTTNNYGGTSINVYVSGCTNNPEQARNTGREIGAETAREMRRRGLVPV